MAYQQPTTKAVTVAGKAQEALDQAQIDPRLLMAAKAIQLMAGQDNDGNPKITGDMAIAAAMYQAGTGQLLGRDFYVNDKIGRMEGYRGVARDANERGVGEVQIKYRSLTAEEAEDHEIQPGDTAVVCEVYQLRAWNLAQRMGQRYEPISGVGVIRKVEKYDKKTTQKWNDNERRYVQQPESQWRNATLEGGMTWRKKAQNRAYKDALRHTPGMPASPEEVIADVAASLDELPPEAARLTMEQAQAWVEQHGAGPDWDAVEGQFTEEQERQPEQPVVRDGKQAQDPPGFSVWADWRNANDAKAWAMTQGKFNAQQHMEHGYDKVKADAKPETAKAMWQAWYEYVTAHEPAKAPVIALAPAADPDGWADIEQHGVDAKAPF